LTDIGVIGKTFIGVEKNQLLLYTFGTLQQSVWKLPVAADSPNRKTVVTKSNLYILREQELLHYVY
jgi:hypothetical protein